MSSSMSCDIDLRGVKRKLESEESDIAETVAAIATVSTSDTIQSKVIESSGESSESESSSGFSETLLPERQRFRLDSLSSNTSTPSLDSSVSLLSLSTPLSSSLSSKSCSPSLLLTSLSSPTNTTLSASNSSLLNQIDAQNNSLSTPNSMISGANNNITVHMETDVQSPSSLSSSESISDEEEDSEEDDDEDEDEEDDEDDEDEDDDYEEDELIAKIDLHYNSQCTATDRSQLLVESPYGTDEYEEHTVSNDSQQPSTESTTTSSNNESRSQFGTSTNNILTSTSSFTNLTGNTCYSSNTHELNLGSLSTTTSRDNVSTGGNGTGQMAGNNGYYCSYNNDHSSQVNNNQTHHKSSAFSQHLSATSTTNPSQSAYNRSNSSSNNNNNLLRQRQHIFHLSMIKLNQYRQSADLSLHRSVMICNTLRMLEKDLENDGCIMAGNAGSPTSVVPFIPPSVSRDLEFLPILQTPLTQTGNSQSQSDAPMSSEVSPFVRSSTTSSPYSSNQTCEPVNLDNCADYDKYFPIESSSPSGRVTPFVKSYSNENNSSVDTNSIDNNSAFWVPNNLNDDHSMSTSSPPASPGTASTSWNSMISYSSSANNSQSTSNTSSLSDTEMVTDEQSSVTTTNSSQQQQQQSGTETCNGSQSCSSTTSITMDQSSAQQSTAITTQSNNCSMLTTCPANGYSLTAASVTTAASSSATTSSCTISMNENSSATNQPTTYGALMPTPSTLTMSTSTQPTQSSTGSNPTASSIDQHSNSNTNSSNSSCNSTMANVSSTTCTPSLNSYINSYIPYTNGIETEMFSDIDVTLYDFDLLTPLSPPNINKPIISAEDLIRNINSSANTTISDCGSTLTINGHYATATFNGFSGQNYTSSSALPSSTLSSTATTTSSTSSGNNYSCSSATVNAANSHHQITLMPANINGSSAAAGSATSTVTALQPNCGTISTSVSTGLHLLNHGPSGRYYKTPEERDQQAITTIKCHN